MRLTIADNPGLAMKAHVFLDGVDISSRCYGADEEKGEAYCYIQDGVFTKILHTDDCKISHQTRCTLSAGVVDLTCTLDPSGCQFARETLKGNVKIELPEAA